MKNDDLLSAPPTVPRRSRSRSKEEGIVGRVDTIEDIKIKNINERVVNKVTLINGVTYFWQNWVVLGWKNQHT